MRLIKGLPEERLFDRIRKFNRVSGVSQRALGFYLLDFDRRRLYRKMGFAGTAQFALMKLHVDPKKTRELLRIARALEVLTLIDEAFAKGQVSWSAVREVTRVAVKETEDEWLDLAKKGRLRKIEHAVSRARRGDGPPKDPYSLSRTRLKVMAELPIEDYAVWKAAFDRLAEVSGGELDVSTALLLLSTSYLERPLGEGEKAARKAFQVVYHRCGECDRAWVETDDGPAGVPVKKVGWREGFAEVVKLEEGGGVRGAGECGRVHGREDRFQKGVESAKEGDVPAAEEKGAGNGVSRRVGMKPENIGDHTKIDQNCTAEDVPRGPWLSPGHNGDRAKINNDSVVKDAPRVPRGACVSPLNRSPGQSCGPANGVRNTLDGSCALKMQLVPMADRDKPNTPLIRQQVLSRDGQCCATPGCTHQGELFSHHVKWRSLGGRTLLINEVCVCQRCHSLIHEGLLKLEGTAPNGLRWYGADGEPLEAIVGCTHLEGHREGSARFTIEPRGGALRGAQAGVPPGTDVSRENKDEEVEDTTIYSTDEVPDEMTQDLTEAERRRLGQFEMAPRRFQSYKHSAGFARSRQRSACS